MNERRDEIEIDLREMFYILKKRALIILLTAVVFTGGAAVYSYFIADPVYESTSKLYIITQSTSITSLADIQVGTSLTTDYNELIQSKFVVEEVITNLKLDMEYEQLKGMLIVTTPVDTRILNISIRDTDASQAAKIANEFSTVVSKRISEVMQTDEPTVFETAQVSDQPVEPEKMKNLAIAFLFGLFLSAIVIIIKHILNDTIKSQEDIEHYLGVNTLASIPDKNERKNRSILKTKGEKD